MRCGLFTKQSDRSGVLSNSILTLCLHCASSRVFKVFVMARCVTWSSLIALAFELKYGFRVFNRGNYKLIENILKDIKMSWRKKKKLSSAAIRQDRSHSTSSSIHLPPLKVTVKVFFWPWMMMKLEDNKEDGVFQRPAFAIQGNLCSIQPNNIAPSFCLQSPIYFFTESLL